MMSMMTKKKAERKNVRPSPRLNAFAPSHWLTTVGLGRKIEIAFIKDKSRRHITFSKRKAGIMKKVPFSPAPQLQLGSGALFEVVANCDLGL